MHVKWLKNYINTMINMATLSWKRFMEVDVRKVIVSYCDMVGGRLSEIQWS